MTDYYDLGSYSRTITTTAPEAQLWFDCGLVWCYGFNHNEMIATLPEELLKVETPPMADWAEGFVPMKMHVLITSGVCTIFMSVYRGWARQMKPI